MRLISAEGSPDGQVSLTIEDTGLGIEEYYLERVFEPFFTTKGTGKGKGLGLSICKQIVRDCNGRITIDSSPEKGTVVTISFPALEASASLDLDT